MKTKLTMQMPEALEARNVEITGVIILPDNEYQTILANGQLPERYLDRLNFSPKTKKKLCMDSVIGYATGLQHFIKTDSLVNIRRHYHAVTIIMEDEYEKIYRYNQLQ